MYGARDCLTESVINVDGKGIIGFLSWLGQTKCQAAIETGSLCSSLLPSSSSKFFSFPLWFMYFYRVTEMFSKISEDIS